MLGSGLVNLAAGVVDVVGVVFNRGALFDSARALASRPPLGTALVSSG